MRLLYIRIFLLFLIAVLSFGLWTIFSPGLMNADSIVQYQQALAGNFNDWHPPVISIVLHYILKIGGDIGTVTLLQIFIGFFGVYFLTRTLLKHFQLADAFRIEVYSFLILLVLASPISAFSYYMLSFIKDAYLAICLVWTAYLSLSLLNHLKFFFLKFPLMILGMTMALLLRHNALVLLPVFFLIIYQILKKDTFGFKNTLLRKSVYAVVAIVPLLLFLLFNSLMYSIYDVKTTHPADQVIAMETLGVIVEDPGLKAELTYFSEHLIPEYEEAYIPGNVAPVMKWGPIKAVDESFDIHNKKLRSEYFSLYSRAPLTLIEVKFKGFLNMLFPEYRYWFHPQLDENNYGLIQNESFRNIRNSLINSSQRIYSNDFFSLFFGKHSIWFFLNLLAIIFIAYRKKTDPGLLLILLLPFFYYLSYFLAATGPQFRFMLPSTLIVQLIILSKIAATIHLSRFGKWKAKSF